MNVIAKRGGRRRDPRPARILPCAAREPSDVREAETSAPRERVAVVPTRGSLPARPSSWTGAAPVSIVKP